MNKKITSLIIISILALYGMVGCTFQSIDKDKDININKEKTLVVCKSEGNKSNNIYYDYENDKISTKSIKGEEVNESTMIFNASSTGEYQLIKNTSMKTNDKLYNTLTNTFITFNSNKISYIGEGKYNLYFLEYTESTIRIISYDIKNKIFKQIKEYNFKGIFVESIGHYDANEDLFYWSCADENGSRLVVIDKNNDIQDYLIDEQQLSNIAVLKNTDKEFLIYKGFNCNTTPYTYSPEIITIEKSTSKITKSEEISIFKNESRELLFSQIEGDNMYLVFKNGGVNISVFKLNNGNFKLLGSCNNYDFQAVKITDDKIIIFDGEKGINFSKN